MNENDRLSPSENESPITPELEARIVAWLAGEASDFEAAELARIVAERPAAARFKHEIEATHTLVSAAARPDPTPRRLSAERRAKLLATLGGDAASVSSSAESRTAAAGRDAAPGRPSPNVSEPPTRRRTWPVPPWIVGLAACAAFGVFVAFETRTSPAVFELASGQVAANEKKLEKRETATAAQAREAAAKASLDEAPGLSVGAARADYFAPPASVAPAQVPLGQLTMGGIAESKPQPKLELTKPNESLVLSPFEIRSEKDVRFGADSRAQGYIGSRFGLGAPTTGAAATGAVTLSALAEHADSERKRANDDQPKAKTLAVLPPAPLDSVAAKEAASTFSLHVSDVSFRLAQAALARGTLPDPATVRPEEFYNAFLSADPLPTELEKISCRIEQAAHPFLAQRNLARIALRVAATGRSATQPLRLTVLVDTSGSMEREDRVVIVRRAMTALVAQLGPSDRLSVIGFARQPRLLADNLPGDRARNLLDLLARTPADGGTNFEEALKLAGEHATRRFQSGAQNRIVVLTDGAANLGNAVPAQLAAQVTRLRERGIAFDACGVGLDGLDDDLLEALTRQGDGRYYVLNSPAEADANFAQKLAGAFRPAAENVKVQVRFNPARVTTYRLIGFDRHRLREEDFRNDRVDAAELAAEEAGVAVYELAPLPQGEGDIGEVLVRFRDPATGSTVERSWTIPYEGRASAFDRAAPSLQLAGVAALLAEKLRADPHAAEIRLRDLAPVVSALPTLFRGDARVPQLVTMFAQARRLTGE